MRRGICLLMAGAAALAACSRVEAVDPAAVSPPAADADDGAGADGVGAAAPVMPAPRGGHDVLGRDVSALWPERWLGERPAFGTADAPRATLVRFWTDTCPFCVRSLPAVEALREEFADGGLATVGVYHPKPPRPVSDAAVVEAARVRGYTGPVAIDPDWAMLEALWLNGPRRAATSAAFLLDAQGRVRFVHPGPEFFFSDEPDDAAADADARALRQAIEALLGE